MTEKGAFLRKLNEAFANNDTDYLTESVTDDIRWTIVGNRTVEGKEAFRAVLKEMEADQPLVLTINHIITDGRVGSVDGVMTVPEGSGNGKAYAFCDVYQFSGFKNPKIKSLSQKVCVQSESERKIRRQGVRSRRPDRDGDAAERSHRILQPLVAHRGFWDGL